MAVKTVRRPRRKRIEKTGTVSKWGNSLGLRIPREAVEQLHLKAGGEVELEIVYERMVIRPAKRRKKWTEAELLKGVTPEMCGPDLIPDRVGRELI